MRTFIFIFGCLVFASLNAQDQSVKKQLSSHSWQQRPTSITWNFNENSDFSAILFWINKKKFGFTAKKGTFHINNKAKIMEMTFDSIYTVYSRDSFSVSKDDSLKV